MLTQAPRGTYDFYGSELIRWKKVEAEIEKVTREFNFKEIRTPMFEHTELFQRGIGDATDVVQKEMYTFEDKGGRSITLRPEGTAGAGRAFLEHSLFAEPQPTKLYYVDQCFRYEKPQAGRDRQFTQFGCEVYGSSDPSADAEVMAMAYTLLTRLGISNVTLHLNSLGCPDCRARYNRILTEYLSSHKEELCGTCQERLGRNPLRILDCKSPVCQSIVKGAPSTLSNLCDDCKAHFEGIQKNLRAMDIPFTVDPGIVRGLDYYTRTVFEFVCNDIGAQGTVCGGGRYDGLIEELGGPHLPSLGWAMGLERLLIVLEACGYKFPEPPACEVYFAPMGDAAAKACFALANKLRAGGVSAETDIAGRGLKAQMKYADKLGARYVIVVGDNELETGDVQLKEMKTGEVTPAKLDESLYTTLYNKALDRQLSGMADLLADVAE